MPIHLLRPEEIDDSLSLKWHALRAAGESTHFESPFFTPEFARVAGAVRPAARVAVVESAGEVVGVFAHERAPLGFGSPIAAQMSDYHGIVADPLASLDPLEIIRGSGLTNWRFEYTARGSPGFEPFVSRGQYGWLVRLDDGIDAYKRDSQTRNNWVRRSEQRLRRMEREHGPVRFEVDTDDPQAFERLAEWKSQQYRRTDQLDNFAIPWVREYLERIRASREPALTGLMSALYVGDRVVAVHLGMRSETVWHYYMPAFDREFGPYSPGSGLLLRMLEAAPVLGVRTLDLGEGDLEYKVAASNDRIELVGGVIESRAAAIARRSARTVVDWMKRSETLRRAARWGKHRMSYLAGSLR